MFGFSRMRTVELSRDEDGHRNWWYPVVEMPGENCMPDIPIGSLCPHDDYAYFVGYEERQGRRCAHYTTRLAMTPAPLIIEE